MRKILTVASSVVLSSAIYAQDINIVQGWQIKGSDSALSLDKFDKNCIDTIWSYDTANNSWKAYSPKTATQTLINNSQAINDLSSLNKSNHSAPSQTRHIIFAAQGIS